MSKQENLEDNIQTESLTVIELTAEQAEATKAGAQECAHHEGAFMANLFSATSVIR